MKKLTVVCKGETMTEYHSSVESANNRVSWLCKHFEVVSFELQDVVKHVEIKSEESKQITKENYSKIQ